MTQDQITDLIQRAAALRATLENNRAELPATLNGDAALREALMQLGISVTNRCNEVGMGAAWRWSRRK